jgi:hypothetical protein
MKKTITFAALALMVTIISIGCKKDTVTVTNTVDVSDNSTMGLLTQKQWEVDTLYYNFTGPGTGTLEYARGAASNLINEDNVRDIYWRDGTADYFDNSGNYQPNITWSFTNSDSTALIINSSIPLHGKILRLDATHYNFFDSTSHAEDVQVYKP